jgi:hypothetical protein
LTESDDDYPFLLEAIEEAEDQPEHARAELALAIFLLSRNYLLSSLDFERLFDFRGDVSRLAEARAAFHNLACEHIFFRLTESERGVRGDHPSVHSLMYISV